MTTPEFAMYFTQTAEYALRAMVYLATLGKGEAIRAADLSERTQIPSHYLSKIMRRLVVDGLVSSQRGHHGGFRLAKSPEDVRFVDILEAVDYRGEPERCAFGWGACDSEYPCPLHEAWSELNLTFLEWANSNTLADMRWDRDELDQLLLSRTSSGS
jgi:Rrf2 family protein